MSKRVGYFAGNVQVIWLDDTSAFVVLHKKDQAEHGNYTLLNFRLILKQGVLTDNISNVISSDPLI